MIGIYKIVSPSGKVYIGQSRNIEKRFKNYQNGGKWISEQRKLYNSLNKYGSENHQYIIQEECIEDIINEREIYWIKHYDAVKQGLNIKDGGLGGKWTDESKKRLSDALTGKKQSEETIEKRRKKIKGLTRSPESRLNISKGKTGVPVTWGEKIKESKLKNPYIPSEEVKLKQRYCNVKPIEQYDLEGNLLEVFFSSAEATRQTGVKSDNICSCLKGKSKRAGKFRWKYKIEE